MIARWVLHIEFHRGYRPRLSFRRAPRSGDRVNNGGVPCVLERCHHCGEGFLAREIDPPSGVTTAPIGPDTESSRP